MIYKLGINTCKNTYLIKILLVSRIYKEFSKLNDRITNNQIFKIGKRFEQIFTKDDIQIENKDYNDA